jgi:prepilin-type N-terminal cleavage/methylation domain-containing protein
MSLSIKKGFTLIEIIIVVWILSILVVSSIAFVNNWLNFTKVTRQKVIAINFAREWIESVYQIRDTNWQKRPWKKDECWLKLDPLNDVSGDWCENDSWMWSGNYIIAQEWSDSKYFILSWWLIPWFNIADWTSGNNIFYRLCFLSWQRKACPNIDRSIWKSAEWIYLRQISWKWVFLKNTNIEWWTYIDCTKWDDPNCWDDQAKEYRFCSKVWYMWWNQGEIEICALITNFVK